MKSSDSRRSALRDNGRSETRSMISSKHFALSTSGVARACDLRAMFDGRDRTIGRTHRIGRR